MKVCNRTIHRDEAGLFSAWTSSVLAIFYCEVSVVFRLWTDEHDWDKWGHHVSSALPLPRFKDRQIYPRRPHNHSTTLLQDRRPTTAGDRLWRRRRCCWRLSLVCMMHSCDLIQFQQPRPSGNAPQGLWSLESSPRTGHYHEPHLDCALFHAYVASEIETSMHAFLIGRVLPVIMEKGKRAHSCRREGRHL